MSWIGRPLKRKEDPRLLKGLGRFVDDVRLPGLLHAVFLRSERAHARVVGLDVEAARRAPGVWAVLTGADLPPYPLPVAPAVEGMVMPPQFFMATEEVNYVGERVAVVVADSRAQALDALALIKVEYEILPVCLDPLVEDAPLVHADLESNLAYTWSSAQGPDPEGDFLTEEFELDYPRVIPTPLEARGVVASFDAGANEMTVWCSHQRPHLLRDVLAKQTQLPENRVRVIAPDVGGGFGCKVNVYGEEAIVANLARILGRPVKWVEGRAENRVATNHGRAQRAKIKASFTAEAKLLEVKADISVDLGAFHQFLSAAIPPLTGMMMSGPYAVPRVEARVRGFFTNKTPTDAYRGAGKPEATFYLERLMDRIARRLELDPAEVRRRNFIAAEAFPCPVATGLFYDSGNYVQALEKALAEIGYGEFRRRQAQARQEGKLLGLGLSSFVEMAGVGPSFIIPGGGWETATVRLERSGEVTVLTGISPHGQGQQICFAQLVAERLGVDPERVVVRHGDTAIVPQGTGTFGSRGTTLGGTALLMALDKLQAKLEAIKEALGGGQLEELVEAAYSARGLPQGMEPGLEATAYYDPANFTFPFGTHVATVEIDRDTGEWKVLRYVAVDDCGTVINPLLFDGQVHGGVIQGFGQVWCEGVDYATDGSLLNSTIAMPRAADAFRVEAHRFETASPINPLGMKGVGEAGTVASVPALVNALSDALGPEYRQELRLPVLPEQLWRALR